MTLPSGDSERLATLLTSLLGRVGPASPAPESVHGTVEPLVHMLLYSFLLWESTPAHATDGLAALYASIVDLNELRVAMPQEIVDCVGMRDRASLERADRLRAALNSIYRREHRVSLERLAGASKREVREYLDALDGVPAFVAARVTLLGFHGHAVPIDRRRFDLLVREGVLEPTLTLDEAERWLERQIRASDAEQIVLVLDNWREPVTPTETLRKPGNKKPAAKAPRGAATPQPKKKDA